MVTKQTADVASIRWAELADGSLFKGRVPDLVVARHGFWIDDVPSGTQVDTNDSVLPHPLVSAALLAAPVKTKGPTRGPMVMVDLRVTDPEGRAVTDADVTFLSAHPDGGDAVRTDSVGRALLCVAPAPAASQNQLVVEAPGYWGLRLEAPLLKSSAETKGLHNTLVLQPVSRAAIDSPCWGYEAMRLDMAPQGTVLGARPVRVAVVACHPWGGPASGFVSETVSDMAENDPVTGWTKTRPRQPDHVVLDPITSTVVGLVHLCAPGVEMRRIFLPRLAKISDLIAALDHCLRVGTDVLCFATALSRPNKALHQALRLARAEGLVMVSPAGDMIGDVAFPASVPEVLGVAALGCPARQPVSSPHFRLIGGPCSEGTAPFGFGATGQCIDVIAPGIAVIVNNEQVSGTIVAAGNVTGFIARLLQSSPELCSKPRNAQRAQAVEALLHANCTDLGLSPGVQGAGLPVWGQKGKARLSARMELQMAENAQKVLDRLARLQA